MVVDIEVSEGVRTSARLTHNANKSAEFAFVFSGAIFLIESPLFGDWLYACAYLRVSSIRDIRALSFYFVVPIMICVY